MADSENWTPAEGGCPCRKIRYRLEKPPLIVHCCHCRWCQKETGTAFALNIVLEAKYVTLLSSEEPVVATSPSESGKGQKIHRCPSCKFVVWSNYGDSGDRSRFVRAGTLDDPSKTPPDVHIFTSSKLPWVILDDKIPAYEEFYERREPWSKASIERLDDLIQSLKDLELEAKS